MQAADSTGESASRHFGFGPMTTPPNTQPRKSRPMMSDIDVFGLTHQGKVRKENQDQFLIASLHKTMNVHATSLPAEHLPELTSESRGFVFLVADGVGGRPGGREASELALRAVASYVTHTMRFYYHHDPAQEAEFLRDLKASVIHSHETIRAASDEAEDFEGMATTLTMVAALWPRAYLIQVGDSRCYLLRDGKLTQMSKDQTIAQAMIDAGVLEASTAERSPFKHILSGAVGGHEAKPIVTVSDHQWDDVMLLCTDGLTKHVTDEEIRQHMLENESSEVICRKLVDLTLERGASDNVTVVVGRLRKADAGETQGQGS
jgi:serine/threonine protein phosphatase PrpC